MLSGLAGGHAKLFSLVGGVCGQGGMIGRAQKAAANTLWELTKRQCEALACSFK